MPGDSLTSTYPYRARQPSWAQHQARHLHSTLDVDFVHRYLIILLDFYMRFAVTDRPYGVPKSVSKHELLILENCPVYHVLFIKNPSSSYDHIRWEKALSLLCFDYIPCYQAGDLTVID